MCVVFTVNYSFYERWHLINNETFLMTDSVNFKIKSTQSMCIYRDNYLSILSAGAPPALALDLVTASSASTDYDEAREQQTRKEHMPGPSVVNVM
jgi:hypothetical protein